MRKTQFQNKNVSAVCIMYDIFMGCFGTPFKANCPEQEYKHVVISHFLPLPVGLLSVQSIFVERTHSPKGIQLVTFVRTALSHNV